MERIEMIREAHICVMRKKEKLEPKRPPSRRVLWRVCKYCNEFYNLQDENTTPDFCKPVCKEKSKLLYSQSRATKRVVTKKRQKETITTDERKRLKKLIKAAIDLSETIDCASAMRCSKRQALLWLRELERAGVLKNTHMGGRKRNLWSLVECPEVKKLKGTE